MTKRPLTVKVICECITVHMLNPQSGGACWLIPGASPLQAAAPGLPITTQISAWPSTWDSFTKKTEIKLKWFHERKASVRLMTSWQRKDGKCAARWRLLGPPRPVSLATHHGVGSAFLAETRGKGGAEVH